MNSPFKAELSAIQCFPERPNETITIIMPLIQWIFKQFRYGDNEDFRPNDRVTSLWQRKKLLFL